CSGCVRHDESSSFAEIGFRGEFGVGAAPAGPSSARDDTAGQLTSIGICEHQIDWSAKFAAAGTAVASAPVASPLRATLTLWRCSPAVLAEPVLLAPGEHMLHGRDGGGFFIREVFGRCRGHSG